jgi:hypothetical protein
VLSVGQDRAYEGELMATEAYDEDVAMSEPAIAPGYDGAGSDASLLPQEERLIIRNRSMRLEVDDVADTVDEIRDLADAHAGIVTNVQISTDDGYFYMYDDYGRTEGSGDTMSGWVTIRVPAEGFDDFVDAVIDLGMVLWENDSLDDVTQQAVDLEARLENLRAEEVRLREFLDAAENVEEMLLVEAQLARVRGEIESMDAQIKYLERQAAMGTVSIELTEPKAVVRPDGPDWGFTAAFTRGLQLAADIVNGVIVLGIGLLPIALVVFTPVIIVILVVRARRRRRESGK